jgi:hypothetical protein
MQAAMATTMSFSPDQTEPSFMIATAVTFWDAASRIFVETFASAIAGVK